MNTTAKSWQIAQPITALAEQSLQGYPPVLRQILYNRGYATREEASQFLQAHKPQHTNPFDLKGLNAAVERIFQAIKTGEKIAIYGDYDADGVTATALLILFFRRIEANVIAYIPNRFDEGYGLNIEALNQLENEGASLVITVDCGIRSIEEAAHAQELGLELIITDHHHPGPRLPAATAIIDPKQPDDTYLEKELAGVGIAYKLIEGLSQKLGEQAPDPEDFLEFVALGTVADLAPLVGENRYLVRQGIRYLQRPRYQGIMSLIGVAGLKPESITATDIGFGLGPRINAAGRLTSADFALDLLTTNDVGTAAYLAQQLEAQNQERQSLTRKIQQKADELARQKQSSPNLLFAVHPDFNPGVVGLAAARLVDQYHRPAVVGHIGTEFTRASCRSIEGFHITQALDQCTDLLEYHGGHAAAAGFNVQNANLIELEERLTILAEEQLADWETQPRLSIDAEVPLSELNMNTIEYLRWLEPTGYGNPLAVFCSRGVQVKTKRTVGKDQSHLKLTVTDGFVTFDAIGFRLGHWLTNLPARIDIAYTFEINEFRGRETLQLNLKDLKPT